MPPSVAGSTLTHVFRQATTKRHFEQLEMQFPAGCCTNITWQMGPRTTFSTTRTGARPRADTSSQVAEITGQLCHSPAHAMARSGARESGYRSFDDPKGSRMEPPPDRPESGEQHLSRPSSAVDSRHRIRLGASRLEGYPALRRRAAQDGGEDGIRTHDTALDRITV
jgi:hypothetical protein